MARYEFTYPSMVESEEQMLDDLGRVLDSIPVGREALRGFVVAVCEAFTNALLHGNGSNPDKIIRVGLEVNQNGISADITDEGKGGLERIRRRAHRGLMAEGGRGIDLIQHYSDAVEFTETEKGGLIVTIFIQLRKKENIQVQ
jgi:anti-sigma regulatory factor (Ser/Thr protein kinase)